MYRSTDAFYHGLLNNSNVEAFFLALVKGERTHRPNGLTGTPDIGTWYKKYPGNSSSPAAEACQFLNSDKYSYWEDIAARFKWNDFSSTHQEIGVPYFIDQDNAVEDITDDNMVSAIKRKRGTRESLLGLATQKFENALLFYQNHSSYLSSLTTTPVRVTERILQTRPRQLTDIVSENSNAMNQPPEVGNGLMREIRNALFHTSNDKTGVAASAIIPDFLGDAIRLSISQVVDGQMQKWLGTEAQTKVGASRRIFNIPEIGVKNYLNDTKSSWETPGERTFGNSKKDINNTRTADIRAQIAAIDDLNAWAQILEYFMDLRQLMKLKEQGNLQPRTDGESYRVRYDVNKLTKSGIEESPNSLLFNDENGENVFDDTPRRIKNNDTDPDYPFSRNTGKTISININKPMIENCTVNANSVNEGINDIKYRVEAVLLEILNNVNAIQ